MSRSGDALERALRRARANPRQQWLPHVDGAPAAGSQRKLSRSIGTRPRGNDAGPPQRALTERERFALELELARIEWAADGGDGCVCSTDEGDAATLDLEWMLRGPLLEAMAALLLRAPSACAESGRQSEDSIGAAE